MKFLNLLRLGFKPVFILLCNFEVFMFSFRFRPEMNINSSWNSPGENTWVSSLSLLQGIIPTQGSNPGLPHYRQILYQLRHKRSPRILELSSLSLLQWIFPTQESNHCLLHCRRILCQLSYEGSLILVGVIKNCFFFPSL